MLSKRYFNTIDEVEVTFEIGRPEAPKVEWVAETMHWSPIEMKRASRRNGPWRLKVRAPKDRPVQFRYRFDDGTTTKPPTPTGRTTWARTTRRCSPAETSSHDGSDTPDSREISFTMTSGASQLRQ